MYKIVYIIPYLSDAAKLVPDGWHEPLSQRGPILLSSDASLAPVRSRMTDNSGHLF